jgi:hypothetical protein
VQAINVALTLRNWLIGYHIVEYEQHSSDRAQYGERLLDELARDLRRSIGKGFTKRYLELFRQFYLRYPIAQSLIAQLGISLPALEEGENPPVGIILCSEKNETHVEYALGGLSNQVFGSRYLLQLPTKEDLEVFMHQTRRQLEK